MDASYDFYFGLRHHCYYIIGGFYCHHTRYVLLNSPQHSWGFKHFNYPIYDLTDYDIEIIVQASALHDIGKICIPDNILLKAGRLSEKEFELIKSHTTKGCEILAQMKDIQDEKYSEASMQICRHHHEKYDGSGYPDGLKGDEIPLSAQIVSIADVYDSLLSKRVYKNAYDPQKAYTMIMNGECGTFSSTILDCLSKSREKLEVLYVAVPQQ